MIAEPSFVFADFDGVVRIPRQLEDGGYSQQSEFCPDRLKRLRDLCVQTGAKIVVTSDLRENGRDWVMKHLNPWITDDLMADEWETPKLDGQIDRHEEVWEWMANRRIKRMRFAILEDTRKHFRDAPEFMADRVVWCNNRHGFVPSLYASAIGMFAEPVCIY